MTGIPVLASLSPSLQWPATHSERSFHYQAAYPPSQLQVAVSKNQELAACQERLVSKPERRLPASPSEAMGPEEKEVTSQGWLAA